MHTCVNFFPGRSSCLASFPHCLMCDPLTTSKYPLGLDMLIVLPDVYSQMNLHTGVKFGSERSSCLRQDRRRLLRLVRFLAAVGAESRKTRQKHHLYIGNYNSGPSMLTSTSLTFFTAIFLAFRGSLAEVLMVMCRHVTTELHIYNI